MFCLNFVFSKLLPSASISRQSESEQNVRFYLNLAQYVMYFSVTLQKERKKKSFCEYILFSLFGMFYLRCFFCSFKDIDNNKIQ